MIRRIRFKLSRSIHGIRTTNEPQQQQQWTTASRRESDVRAKRGHDKATRKATGTRQRFATNLASTRQSYPGICHTLSLEAIGIHPDVVALGPNKEKHGSEVQDIGETATGFTPALEISASHAKLWALLMVAQRVCSPMREAGGEGVEARQ